MIDQIAAVGEESIVSTWVTFVSMEPLSVFPALLRKGSSSLNRASASSEVWMSVGSKSPWSISSRSMLVREEEVVWNGYFLCFLRNIADRGVGEIPHHVYPLELACPGV